VDLLLQIGNPLLLGGMVGPGFRLKGSRAVLEEFLLPAVEDGGLESLFVTQLEIGTCSSKCLLRIATFSSGV
jgi:hypothetical protein